MNQITIGLAGHIDHGKTSIVKQLTGKNTDNLKEEIKRGMTIDIGFAHFSKTISLIDVPGHEKFIKNMVSGVNSIDFAIIVIAANDGIMPQTIEHFEILQFLNIKSGLIVINKIDLVDAELIELVELEIRDFVKNTFLEDSKVLKISASTGQGIKNLKNEISNLNQNVINKFDRNIFRMFIDRVFTVKGFGTVVTGTVSSGKIKIGECVELLPDSKILKIRGLQSHDEDVNEVIMGQRAAINIHSFDKLNIKRGKHLSIKNYFKTSYKIAVRIKTLSKANKKIKHNQRVRLHLGTQEIIGRILLLDKKINSSFPAIINLETPIIASFKDRFIIRSFSPISTLAGGVILDVNIRGKWNMIKEYSKVLNDSKSNKEIITYILEYSIKKIYSLNSLAQKLGISVDLLKIELSKISNLIKIKSKEEWLLTRDHLDKIENSILLWLRNKHEKYSYKRGYLKEEINEKFNFEKIILEFILSNLINKKQIKLNKDNYSIIDFKINLNQNDKRIKNKLVKMLLTDQFNIYSTREISEQINEKNEDIVKVIKIEVNNYNLLLLSDDLVLSNDSFNGLKEKILKHFNNNESLNIKEFKDMFNISRKYAVPLLEYLDKQKITYRDGNVRKINKL